MVLQAFVFVMYIGFLIWRYGTLPSISESWYVLPYDERWMFTFFTWMIGVPMLFYGNAPLFLSGAGLTFVGVATRFKLKRSYTRIIHFFGAAMGIIIPLVYFALSNGFIWPLILQVISTGLIVGIKKVKDKLWWIEIAAFFFIIIGLIEFVF